MRVLVFGVNGMLGHKLYQRLGLNFDVFGTIRKSFDTVSRFAIFDEKKIVEYVDAFDRESVRRSIETVEPDVVINAVGVIKQIPTSKDVIKTLTINSIFPHLLAEFSGKYGFRLITVSTDCVFSGEKGNYNESDPPDARDLYGMSKLLGEIAANGSLTIRTSIIGREIETGHSIVEWFLKNQGGTVNGFTKAIYTGLPTHTFANILTDIIINHQDLKGCWHISTDPITKYDLLKLLNEYYRANVEIRPSEEVVIDRSLDSTRFRNKTGFSPGSWPEMIAQMASDRTPYGNWSEASNSN